MAVKQMMLPANRAFNSDGAPEAGAMAILYESGTSTPAIFYEDPSLTIPLGDTITANAAGRFTPMPYQDETVAFRLVITDAEGAVLDDIDPFYFGFQTGAAGPTGPAGDMSKVASRGALAAIAGPANGATRYNTESGGRDGIFVFLASNYSTQVTSDPNQGIYVPPLSDPTGASGCWVRKYDGPISVDWFGAVGDSNATGSIGTDDTAAIQAAANLIGTIGGGTLYFPAGYYKVTAYISLPQNIVIAGAGKNASHIIGTHAGGGGANAFENARNGSILTQIEPVNTTTGTYSKFRDIRLFNSNGANQGAGLYLQANDEVCIEGCAIGAKYGIILDQTEDINVIDCDLTSWVSGGYAVWIAPGLYPGALAGFTNVLTFSGCHINTTAGTHGVRIEGGGYIHNFIGCDFNGGSVGLYGTGVNCLSIDKCYFESQSANCIQLSGAAAPPITNITDCFFNCGNAAILGILGSGNAGVLKVGGNTLFTGGSGVHNPIEGGNNFTRLQIDATVTNGSSVATLYDAEPGILIDDYNAKYRTASTQTVVWGTAIQNGLSGGTDASRAQTYYGYDQTANYRHALVTRHAGGSTNGNAMEFWLHTTEAAADLPSILSASITYRNIAVPADGTRGGINLNASANGNGYLEIYSPANVRQGYIGYINGTRLELNTSGSATGWLVTGDLAVGSTQVFNNTGVLQAAATPAYTGDVTKSAGSLSTVVASAATATGAILTSSASGIGYRTGAGGTVTQVTSRTTGVTINKPCGAITLVSAAGSATWATFTVTNSTVAATDVVEICQKTGSNIYNVIVSAVAAGSFNVSVSAVSGTATEAPVLNFVVTKAVTA